MALLISLKFRAAYWVSQAKEKMEAEKASLPYKNTTN